MIVTKQFFFFLRNLLGPVWIVVFQAKTRVFPRSRRSAVCHLVLRLVFGQFPISVRFPWKSQRTGLGPFIFPPFPCIAVHPCLLLRVENKSEFPKRGLMVLFPTLAWSSITGATNMQVSWFTITLQTDPAHCCGTFYKAELLNGSRVRRASGRAVETCPFSV